jgi:lipoyl(octanoyl) transferase
MRRFIVDDLGTIDYNEAFSLQKRAVEALQSGGGSEMLYLLEHPHVITRGRNASLGSLIASQALLHSKGVMLVETDRGGDVTYHGPGQLVGYPILRLDEERRDIRRYVHDVEETLIRTLADFGIAGRRDTVHRGVWVEDRKIASVGIRISRWVTSHGFALNVSTDLDYFALIHPCGIMGCRMTSMSAEAGHAVDMREVKRAFVGRFSDVFEGQPAALKTVEEEMRHHA